MLRVVNRFPECPLCVGRHPRNAGDVRLVSVRTVDVSVLPSEVAVAALTVAELEGGPTLPRARPDERDATDDSEPRQLPHRCRSMQMRLVRMGESTPQ